MKWNEMILMCACCLCVTFSVLAGADDNVSIWQIGRKDTNFAEFALAGSRDKGQYLDRFGRDVNFIIGKDSPSQAWSYVHPGTANAWAGSREHPFTILFNLEEKKYEGYTFNLHLTSAHSRIPPRISVQINNKTKHIQTTSGSGNRALTDPRAGGQQTHSIIFQDEVLKVGENRITITTQGSWMVYDALELVGHSQLNDVAALEATSQGRYYRRPEGDSRLINIKFIGGLLTQPAQVKIKCQGKTTTHLIDPGDDILQSMQVYLPLAYSDQPVPAEITLNVGSQEITTTTQIPPVRKWEIHLVHQTHLDIGYTHTQEDVLRRQVDHFHKALDYIEASRDYPEEYRFKWHPEGMWAVEEFLRTESDEARKKFIAATRTRDIHIDALYAQAMTGAYSEEELFELIGAAVRYGKKHNVIVNSAMQTDVPGYTWGIVNALAHHGIKYMSAGPNGGHRVGHTFEWGDQPFYWVSPCGQHRILFWMARKGYSWFHGKSIGHSIMSEEAEIMDYLDDLEMQGYPYDMVNIRYSIGSDNGPPNPSLSRFVREWNEKYVWPRLVISRNSDMMQELEKRYGDQLPVVRGDFTPYWEDGMASTAADTGISRRAAEQLVQAQTLWTMLDADAYPHKEFELAWNKLIMYDEHTWGAWNSISDPDGAFSIQQAEYKQKYALDGAKMTTDLFDRGVKTHTKNASGVIDVYNTLNWIRSEVVFLSPEQSKTGDQVENETGRAVASQRLASGELAFLAENIPAFGAKRFFIKKGKAISNDAAVKAMDNSLDNGSVLVTIDPKTGAIKSLIQKEIDAEIVDISKGYGVNDYLYIIGRDASKNNMRIDSPVKISIVDGGPLVGTLKIECDAPGANKLTRTIRITHNSDVVEMLNVVDKLKERRPEGVYFDFPFHIPNGIMQIDTPWAVFQPEKDQLRGANRNFFCVQRFVDISNKDYGVTWMSIDAPIVQWDPIKIAAGAIGTHSFRKTITPNQTIHSWVMNNHWETNYKADQEGLIPFRYAVWPHVGGYDAIKSQQNSRAVHQPLIAITANPKIPVVQPKLEIQGHGIVATSLKPCRDSNGYMVRLFNTSKATSTASLKWKKDGYTIWLSNPMEEKIKKTNGSVEMVSQEIVTLLMSL